MLLLPGLLLAQPVIDSFQVSTNHGNELTIHRYQAEGDRLFIWLPSEAGPQTSEINSAQLLATQNIEVWRINLVEDYFLPVVASSLEQIPANAVSTLISHAINTTGKQVYLVTTGRGVIPVLRGTRHWQIHNPSKPGLGGAILMSPKFFVETPDPGEEGKLMPSVTTTNLPVFILQPDKSPWYWKLGTTIPALQQGGSDVYVRRLANVRDRFNFRPDATREEKQLASQLPSLLLQAQRLLQPYTRIPRLAVRSEQAPPEVRIGKKDRALQVFRGHPIPPALRLADLNGKTMDLIDLKGKVVLVNFWASWCPPCVHEMPSMQRLQDSFHGKPFTILGVNMAEDKQTITSFLQTRVKVNFPIMLDSDGDALKRWGVFAFPTSYVIDKQGKIRYALFGGIEWDTPDIVEKITALVNEVK